MRSVEFGNMRRIKVLFEIVDLDIAGAQSIICDLILYLDKTKFDVCLVVLSECPHNKLSHRLESNGIQVHYLSEKSSNILARIFQRYHYLKKNVRNYDPDFIHANLDYAYIWLFSALHKQPFFETIHSQPYRVISKSRIAVYRYLQNKNLIKPILLTESGQKEFCELFGEKSENTILIPNMVDVKKYAFNRDYHYGVEDVVFVFVARFHEIKNHALLLEAFRDVVDVLPKCRLKLAGDGELSEFLQNKAADLGIQNNVDFLGLIDDVPSLLKQCDVSVISSKSECFPLVLVEAMASGMPVIATAVGGMRDIVKDNGFLVSPFEKNEMANAMIELAKNAELREIMGKKSIELSKQYSCESVTKQYEKIFDNYN